MALWRVSLICLHVAIYSLPGEIINYDQIAQIPIVGLASLDLGNYEKLKIFHADDLPKESNWQQHSWYYTNRNRAVYLTKDHNFVLKVWQKNYPSKDNFLLALHADFYKEIALVSALIFDEDNECRGYISPYMIDRTFNRAEWESFGFVLEKNKINVNVFSHYDLQPQIYKDLFDRLISRGRATKYVSLDFCPNNIAISVQDKMAYLVDLEDVHTVTELNDPLIADIFFYYLADDYLKKIVSLAN